LTDQVTTAIVAALSAGAISGVTDTAKKAIVDGYEQLKVMITKRFGSNSDIAKAVYELEHKPDSRGRRETLAEELQKFNVDADPELLGTAHSLLELINALPKKEQHIQVARGAGIAQADRGSNATVRISGSLTETNDD
jgi:hypothetical protein